MPQGQTRAGRLVPFGGIRPMRPTKVSNSSGVLTQPPAARQATRKSSSSRKAGSAALAASSWSSFSRWTATNRRSTSGTAWTAAASGTAAWASSKATLHSARWNVSPEAFVSASSAGRLVLEELERLGDRALQHGGGERLPLEAEPHVDGADDGGEADEILVEDEPEHAPEGIGMGLVDGLEDDLTQPLLALGGEEQFFPRTPTPRAWRR